MKYLFRTLVVLIVLTFLAFCVYFLTPSKTTKLTLSAGEPGGVYYVIAHSIAHLVNRENPDIRITVSESRGSFENFRKLDKKEADLAIVQNGILDFPDINILVPLYMETLHFLARKDSGITKFQDIAGRKVAVGSRNSGTELALRDLARHYNLSYDDFSPFYFSAIKAGNELLKGNVDAMFFMAGIKAPVMEIIMKDDGVDFVGLGKVLTKGNEAEGFALEHPYAVPYVIPMHTYSTRNNLGKPSAPVLTISVRSLLVGRKDIPEDIVKRIVETIFSGRIKLIKDHVIASRITEVFDSNSLHLPIHPGAQLYYERKNPGFLETYAESMGFLLSAFVVLFTALVGLRQWIAQIKKDRIDTYYLRLDDFFMMLERESLSEKELKKIETSLLRLQHEALKELIDERVSANEEFQILQSLLSECRALLESKRHGLPATDVE